MTKALPYTMVGLSFGAGIVYLVVGDYRRGIYWLLAAAITLTVTV